MSAVAIANSASGTASRQAVASSGRSSTSSTISSTPSVRGDRVGDAPQQGRAARAGRGADQHPLSERQRRQQVDRSGEDVG